MQFIFDLIKVPPGGPQMIWVITCKDNSYEANTGCETVICDDGNDGDDSNDDQAF